MPIGPQQEWAGAGVVGAVVVIVTGALSWFAAALASHDKAEKRLAEFAKALREDFTSRESALRRDLAAHEKEIRDDFRERERALRDYFDRQIKHLEQRLDESQATERALSAENAALRERLATVETMMSERGIALPPAREKTDA